MKRTAAHERALKAKRKAEAKLAVAIAERDQALGIIEGCHRDVHFARTEMERFRREADKSASIVADFRRYLPSVQHHKIQRNIANNELNHVMLTNELAMLRLLVKRGCSVSPQELAEFLAHEAEMAKEGATPLTEALREAVTH